MNAAQVIEEICKLTPEEQKKVVKFVNRLPNQETIDAINEPLEGLSRYKTMDEVRVAIKEAVEES